MVGIGVGAAAQESVPREPEPEAVSAAPLDERLRFEPDWTVRLKPAVGYFAASGDLRLPAPMSGTQASEVKLEDTDLDSPRLSPYGEITLARGKWRVMATGLGLSIDGASMSPVNGMIGDAPVTTADRIESELDYASFSLRGGYRVWSWTDELTEDGRRNLSIGIDAMLGVRLQTVEFSSRVVPAAPPAPGTPLTASADETFVEALGGVGVVIDYRDTLGLDLFLSGGGMPGGDESSTTFDLGVSFSYRPVRWVGGEVGYRLIATSVESGNGADSFEWDGAVAGLYWGVQFRF